MYKIAIVSQARMGSSRLPAKVMLRAGGKALLDWHFDRLASSGLPVILATTIEPVDDTLCDWADKKAIRCYRGSEGNVLSRFYECACRYSLDAIVRVTSDCPLIDGELISQGVGDYLSQNQSRLYVTNGLTRWPRGFDFEIFSFELLEEAYNNAIEPWEIEHVTPYLYKRTRPDIIVRHFNKPIDDSHLRLTVDTSEDFQLVKRLIEECKAGDLTSNELIDLLNVRPDLVSINSHVQQKAVA